MFVKTWQIYCHLKIHHKITCNFHSELYKPLFMVMILFWIKVTLLPHRTIIPCIVAIVTCVMNHHVQMTVSLLQQNLSFDKLETPSADT